MKRVSTPETPVATTATSDTSVTETPTTDTSNADASAATLETVGEAVPMRWFKLLGGAYPLVLPYAPFTRIEPGQELELRETPFLANQVEANIMSVRD